MNKLINQSLFKFATYYRIHCLNSQLTFFKNFSKSEKLSFSAFIEMKMRHKFLNSYFCRLLAYELNWCNENCNEIQISEHLLLNYRHYINEQRELKKNMKSFVTLRTLFNTNENIKNVLKFIKNTRIYTKKWILDTIKSEQKH